MRIDDTTSGHGPDPKSELPLPDSTPRTRRLLSETTISSTGNSGLKGLGLGSISRQGNRQGSLLSRSPSVTEKSPEDRKVEEQGKDPYLSYASLKETKDINESIRRVGVCRIILSIFVGTL